MSPNKYLVRAPRLDPKQQVTGYKFTWQKDKESIGLSGEEDLQQLLECLGDRLAGSTLGTLFLDANSTSLSAPNLQLLTPLNAVLIMDHADLFSPENADLAASVRGRGFEFSLRNAHIDYFQPEESPLPLVTHLEVFADQPDLVEMVSRAKHRQPPLTLLVGQIPGWQEFDACASLGLGGIFGNLCQNPREANALGKMGPQAVLILQLMQMVQENADVRHLEKLLKRDATLSYKLFRYINSASFGMEVEIQSLRHAVAMLGYTPLFRWLSVLLAMTNAKGFSPALLQAAIVRGRFAELLGQGLLAKGETENLFVVGMFSLLDQLLGIPTQVVLDQILLPDSIAQALRSREGVYGPFLALTEACEREDGCASDIAEALFMTPTRVNQAHLAALAWAQHVAI